MIFEAGADISMFENNTLGISSLGLLKSTPQLQSRWPALGCKNGGVLLLLKGNPLPKEPGQEQTLHCCRVAILTSILHRKMAMAWSLPK